MNLTSFQKWHHAKINTFQITEDQSEVPQEIIEVPTEDKIPIEEKILEDIPATPEMVSENEETEEIEEESSEDEPEEPEETGPNAKEKTAMGKFSYFWLVEGLRRISPRQGFVS